LPPSPIVFCAGRWREELPGTPWRWLLAPAWPVYAAGVALRNQAFDRGLRTIHRLPVPVVAVGNLVAGGAGKTPVARHLAHRLSDFGRRPAVVMRGYRGDAAGNDEARLMDGIPVVCDPDRVRGGRTAIAAGADCLVLDDAFQHRRLHRDLDIVVIDATRRLDEPLLPLGYAREPRAALARAGLAWISRAHLAPAPGLGGLPTVREDVPERWLTPVAGGERAEARNLAGQRVVLASGIGHPRGFEMDAGDLGWDVRLSLRFPDHHAYTAADARVITARAAALEAVPVLTAKDAVKLAPLWPAGAPGLVLHARSRLAAADAEVVDAALRKLLSAAGGNRPAP
jgi:tetraacyldisaccharide 4'-kinase